MGGPSAAGFSECVIATGLHDGLKAAYPGAGDHAALKLHETLSVGHGTVIAHHLSPAREHDSPHLGRRVLQALGEGNARQSSVVAERLSELDEQAHQLERRMAM